jgi:hypothetical protein
MNRRRHVVELSSSVQVAQGLLAAIDIAHRQSRQFVLASADLSRGEAQPDA